nr:putative 1-acyl-sn-glycerol-3-phosphate acyltransferase [Quercus suber]
MNGLVFYFAAGAIFLFCTVQALLILGKALQSTTLEFYGRSIASFSALFICAIYGTVSAAVLNVAGYGGLGQWTTARAFKYNMWLFTGVWFEVEDSHDWLGTTRPAVLVGNHQSELDVLFLGHIFPKYCSVTAKRSLRWFPFLGWFMSLSKTVFIERSSRTQALEAFSKAAEQMHTHKQSVYIFPEGTRSYYEQPDLLPFKKGAFHLAIQAQVPMIPIVVANYSNVLNLRKKIFRQGTIKVKVLKPVETKGMTKDEVDGMLAQVRESMLKELQIMTSKAREDGVALQAPSSVNGSAVRRATGVDMKYNAAA